MEWVADVVDLANKRLDNRHAAIGPSYFMRDPLDYDAVHRIWNHSVLPYIQEHLFGEFDRLQEFDLGKLIEASISGETRPNDENQTFDTDHASDQPA